MSITLAVISASSVVSPLFTRFANVAQSAAFAICTVTAETGSAESAAAVASIVKSALFIGSFLLSTNL